jgi:hypothetical protein
MRSEVILPSWNWTTVTVATSTGLFVGGNSGQQPIHLQGMGKLDHELTDKAVVADRAEDGG